MNFPTDSRDNPIFPIEVSFHAEYSTARPAFRIKWHNDACFDWGPLSKFRSGEYAHEYTEENAPDFWAWLDRLDDDERENAFEVADELAREVAYDRFKEDVVELFGLGWDDVWQEGRSGGWMVLDYKVNRDNWGHWTIEDWDDEDFAKYATVWEWLDSYLKPGGECDYQFLWHLAVNVYERERDAAERAVKAREAREEARMQANMAALAG